jgi:DNA invertase Pin-like site-specific DNA recombinase
MKVGLARVSSVGQNLERQIIALKEYGCEKIFEEKQSGTKADNRKVYKEWIDFMRENDEAVVTRIDRASRSIYDLQVLIRELEKKGVTFSATEQSINTKTPEGKCFLNMLSVFSEFETNLRRERQMDGIKANKDKFKGRGQTIDAQRIKTLKNEGWGATKIAKEMNIDRTSVYRLLKKVAV